MGNPVKMERMKCGKQNFGLKNLKNQQIKPSLSIKFHFSTGESVVDKEDQPEL